MNAPLAAGEAFTWLVSGISFLTDATLSGGEQVSRRGQVTVLSSNLIAANLDRAGECLLSLITDPKGQMARWGREIFAPGVVEVTSWEPGTVEHADARAAAREVALAQPDPQLRAEALREVDAVYGRDDNPSHQTSTWVMGDDERAALLRAEGRR